jgi:membrane associated rhomboid family serine protease
VAVNVVVFALELAWGGSDSPLTLHRMGAGLGRAGLAHEPWRIISAAFLHFGVVHLALNMWALVVFGRMLEIILGARRFVVLYALCAAAGGLASSLVHAQILSAGASGAVWGLMTGQIALVVRLRREEGAERAPVQMSTLMQPLVVNLLFSLTPGIDMAAHLGGGVAGAGLILSGLVGWKRPEPAGWRWAAWGASLAMAACLAVALGHGRPWELRWPPSLVAQAIPDTPVIVGVPRGLQPQPSSDKDGRVFGNLGSDPLAAYCAVGKLDVAVAEQSRREYLSQMARDAAARPLEKGQVRDQSPLVVQLRLRPAVFFASHFPKGGRIQTWLMVEGSWWVRLDVVVRPDAPASWAKLPTAIAEGITILPSKVSNQRRLQEDPAPSPAAGSIGESSGERIASGVQGSGRWSPPPHPDPTFILHEADEDAQAKRYERALAKYSWFHRNALKYQPAARGVRLSFAHAAWFELAQVYPPALAPLERPVTRP